mgnify:CR=1 FL=1
MTVRFLPPQLPQKKDGTNRTQPLAAYTEEIDRSLLRPAGEADDPTTVNHSTPGLHSGARPNHQQREVSEMANIKESLEKLNSVSGFIGACLVDSNSGMMLGSHGGGDVINLELAAAGNTEVVRAKRAAMSMLKLKDVIEDILITLGKQYHLIRPIAAKDGLFMYVVLDRTKANLAMGRHALEEIEKGLAL